jgi:hypothetical protein
VIGAKALGGEEDFVGAVHTVAAADDEEVRVRGALGKEIVAAAFERGGEGIDFLEFTKALGDLLASGERIEGGGGAAILRFNPCSGFWAVLVFEPAIGVGNGDAVQGVDSGVFMRWRRARAVGGVILGSRRDASATVNAKKEKEEGNPAMEVAC